jgi:hypothetical protein
MVIIQNLVGALLRIFGLQTSHEKFRDNCAQVRSSRVGDPLSLEQGIDWKCDGGAPLERSRFARHRFNIPDDSTDPIRSQSVAEFVPLWWITATT